MKRLICLFICVIIVFSSFSLPIFAADNGTEIKDSEKYITQGKESGFDEIINVEEYVNNAGKEGYDVLTCICIGVPTYHTSGDLNGTYLAWTIPVYFYNPDLLEFLYPSYETPTFGSAMVKDYDDENEKSYPINYSITNLEEDNSISDKMFFKGYINGSVSGSFEEEDDILNYYVDSISIHGVYDRYDFDIKQSVESNDINAIIGKTDPFYDFMHFFGYDYDEIKTQFPTDVDGEPSIAYMYESNYGTSNYNIYLYIYNPTNNASQRNLQAYMYTNGTFEKVGFEFVSARDTLVKYKMIFPGKYFSDKDLDIRNYYINELFFYSLDSSGNEIHHHIKCSAKFAFSSNDLSEYNGEKFKHVFKFTPKPSSLRPHILYGDPKEFVYFSSKYFDKFEIMDFPCTNNGKSNGFTTDGLPWGFTLTVCCYSDFPALNTSITAGCREGSWVNDGNVLYCESIEKVDERNSVVSLSAYDVDNKVSLYSKSNINGTIDLSVKNTFYRINSSESGNGYHQTLSSVYFRLPKSYLGVDENKVLMNDKYVSAIEVDYEAYMLPISIVKFLDDSDYDLLLHLTTPEEWEKFLRNSEYSKKTYYTEMQREANTEGTYYADTKNYIGPLKDLEAYYSGLGYTNIKYGYERLYSEVGYIFCNELKHENDNDLSSQIDNKAMNILVDRDRIIAAFLEKPLSEKDLLKEDKRENNPPSFEDVHEIIHFDDKFALSNYANASLETMQKDLGWFNGFLAYKFGFEENALDDTVKDIQGIITILPGESEGQIDYVLEMSDSDICNTYLIDESDIADFCSELSLAKANDEAFVILRFDVYDYYAEKVYSGEKINTVLEGIAFQEKLYKDFDILTLEISSDFESEILEVNMDPIMIVAGATFPDRIESGEINFPTVDLSFNIPGFNFKRVFTTIAIVALVIVGINVITNIKRRRDSKK